MDNVLYFANFEVGITFGIMNRRSLVDVGFDNIGDHALLEYKDDDIAFHTDIRHLPLDGGAIRTDMFVLVACLHGKLCLDINMVGYTLPPNNLLVCRPNDIIDNVMLSPDFKGGLLCLSQSGFLSQLADSELWDRAFHIDDNRMMCIGEENIRLISLYGELLQTKIRAKKTFYNREILMSIVKAVLYEVLDYAGDAGYPSNSGMQRRQEVLFRRFLKLISNSRVKDRHVAWYADKLCVTPKYLSAICRRECGRTAIDLVNEYVINDIKYWLKNSDRSVKEIAAILGFPNISFFGKYCRTHIGASPTKLKKRLRE